MEPDRPNSRKSRSSLKDKNSSKEKSILSIHMPEIVSWADEPGEEDIPPPLSGTIDSRGFSEERRVQGGVVPVIDFEVTDDDMNSILFGTLTKPEPINEEKSIVLKSNEEQIGLSHQDVFFLPIPSHPCYNGFLN